MRRIPEATDIACALDVRAPAKLLAVKAARRARIGNGHYADVLLGITVAEEGQRAGGQRIVESGYVRLEGGVLANVIVHLLLDVGQFGRIDGSKVREIEAQTVRRHK